MNFMLTLPAGGLGEEGMQKARNCILGGRRGGKLLL
jgi:hypothetical protein